VTRADFALLGLGILGAALAVIVTRIFVDAFLGG
jgi:hypothetical protein